MADVTGAELVVDSLKREGIDTVYTLPGDPVGPIVNGCAEAGLRVISVRHEQAAAMAAQAHSYFTRSVGVCIAASGVGQTNTLTAIANAQVNCWPMLVIGGSAELRRRNMGRLPRTGTGGVHWAAVQVGIRSRVDPENSDAIKHSAAQGPCRTSGPRLPRSSCRDDFRVRGTTQRFPIPVACSRGPRGRLRNQTGSVRHWTSSDRPSARFS